MAEQAGSLRAQIFGVEQSWFGGEDRVFTWPCLTATKCHQGSSGTVMLFAPSENETLPEEQMQEGGKPRHGAAV